MLKNYIAREPEVDVVHTSNKDDVTIVPDLEKGFEGVRDIKLGEDLSEDQRHMLKYLTQMYPDVFTDMPGEAEVIQHRVKPTDDTPIHCTPYPLRMPWGKSYRMKWTVC